MSTPTQSTRELKSAEASTATADSRAWLWDLFLLVLPVLGLSPLLLVHGVQLWWLPSFQFFPVVVFCLPIGYLLAEKGISREGKRRGFATAFAFIGFVVALYSAWVFSPILACGSLSLLWVAWGLVRLEHDSWSRAICWGGLVATLVPLPRGLDSRIESGLNGLVASCTSRVLDLFQSYHLLQTPYLAVEKRAIDYYEFLDTPFSLRAVFAFILVLAIVRRRSFVVWILASVSGVLCTLVGKVAMLAMAVYMVNSGIAWNQGWHWTLLAWGVAFVAILMASSLDSMWGALLAPIKVGGEVVSIDRTRSADLYNRFVYWPGKIAKRRSRDSREATADATLRNVRVRPYPSIGMILASILVGLLVAPLAMAVVKQRLLVSSLAKVSLPVERSPNSKFFESKTFPGLLLNQYQTSDGSNSLGGLNVHLWNFSGIDAEARILLVFPVDGWKSQWSLGSEEGWELTEESESSLESPWPFVEKAFALTSDEPPKSELLFSSQFTLDGQPYLPSSNELAEQAESKPINRWLEPRLVNYLKTAPQDKAGSLFVVQMQFVSKGPLREEDLTSLRNIFNDVRTRMLNRVAGKDLPSE